MSKKKYVKKSRAKQRRETKARQAARNPRATQAEEDEDSIILISNYWYLGSIDVALHEQTLDVPTVLLESLDQVAHDYIYTRPELRNAVTSVDWEMFCREREEQRSGDPRHEGADYLAFLYVGPITGPGKVYLNCPSDGARIALTERSHIVVPASDVHPATFEPPFHAPETGGYVTFDPDDGETTVDVYMCYWKRTRPNAENASPDEDSWPGVESSTPDFESLVSAEDTEQLCPA
ncbi:hypothetical protein A0H81_08729 [Grifola frondosa]|uniref:Uncharacterized protein n=1 Tax=Grifola frondosa TaxID=5627 RepID=A0A1C7M486_GRIFR|nr:hypothetical protein A0H81_08729 [Grifola frondosa]